MNKANSCTIGTFINGLYSINSLFEDKNLYNKYINDDSQVKPIYEEFSKFLLSKKIVTKKEHSKISNVHFDDIPFDNVIEYNNNSFIDYDKDNNEYLLTLYNASTTSISLFKLEMLLFMEFYLEEILNFFNADTDDLKDKCFCDYCDDFVPTSECETIDVNDDFEVACSECYNNLYKDNK